MFSTVRSACCAMLAACFLRQYFVLVLVILAVPSRAFADPFVSILYTIDPVNGEEADGGLAIIGSKLYGTTSGAFTGSTGLGTVFSLNTDGTDFETLHTFVGTDGANPEGSLTVVGSTLYGATGGTRSGQSPVNYGTVFSIAADGSNFQTVHNFQVNGPDYPISGLASINGQLYGTTTTAIYSVAPDGTNYQTLHQFTGESPHLRLDQGTVTQVGSTLYGVETYGGANNDGVVYAMNSDGSNYHVVHTFSGIPPAGSSNAVDGANPTTDLSVLGSKIYGTTWAGGAANDGTVFSMNLDGSGYQVLHQFNGTDGLRPSSALVSYGDSLYGATASSLFSINPDGSNFQVLDGAGTVGNLLLSGSTLYGVNSSVFAYHLGVQQFTVSPQSTLTMSGSYNGAPIMPQGPGSLTTSVQGNIVADLTDPSHPSLLTSQFTVNSHSGPFQPGDGPAAFAGTATNGSATYTSSWQVSGLTMNGLSNLTVDSQGRFDVSELTLSGTVQVSGAGLPKSPISFSSSANQPGVEGTIVPFDGGYKITIPVHMTVGNLFYPSIDAQIDGQIVAYTSGVPEPASVTMFATAALAFVWLRRPRNRSHNRRENRRA